MFHWSFPWELELVNKKDFMNIVTFSENQEHIINIIKDEIDTKKGSYYEHIKITDFNLFKTFGLAVNVIKLLPYKL